MIFANKLGSNAEKFQYFTSILRSILQAAAICSFEIVKGMTPSTQDDTNVPHLLGRFSLPSDGLPVEALDVLVPIIRSHVSKTYMIGWFEKEQPKRPNACAGPIVLGGVSEQEACAWRFWTKKRCTHLESEARDDRNQMSSSVCDGLAQAQP
ncbi:hypothetical protein ACFS07_04055 [Undibacterium arcticum]